MTHLNPFWRIKDNFPYSSLSILRWVGECAFQCDSQKMSHAVGTRPDRWRQSYHCSLHFQSLNLIIPFKSIFNRDKFKPVNLYFKIKTEIYISNGQTHNRRISWYKSRISFCSWFIWQGKLKIFRHFLWFSLSLWQSG